jgi:hypothetical protein
MKRFQWATPLLLLILTQCAYADSISTFVAQANITFLTNFGSGDNQGSTFTGPGVNLSASGDVSCFWCGLGAYSLTPGSSLTPSVVTDGLDFTFVHGSMTFGGQSQVCFGASGVFGDCGLDASGITALRSFTFPTNGRNFTVTMPATLNGPIGGALGANQFDLQIPSGRLILTFDFVPGQSGGPPAYYQFSQGMFTTTPEPSTLGLMASGLAGIVGTVLRKRNCKR